MLLTQRLLKHQNHSKRRPWVELMRSCNNTKLLLLKTQLNLKKSWKQKIYIKIFQGILIWLSLAQKSSTRNISTILELGKLILLKSLFSISKMENQSLGLCSMKTIILKMKNLLNNQTMILPMTYFLELTNHLLKLSTSSMTFKKMTLLTKVLLSHLGPEIE